MKTERKLMMHYINANPKGPEPAWVRIGSDLEEFNIEMNAEIEKTKNIIGTNSVKLTSYEPQGDVDTYYFEKDDELSAFIQDIIDNRKTLDEAKTEFINVHSWEEPSTGSYTAYKESVIVEPVSYGGDTSGYQTPFNCHFLGDRVKGKFNPSTKKFTPDSLPA